MIIEVPDLTARKAMKFCNNLLNCSLEDDETCYIDFSKIYTCDPFAMIITSNAIRLFRRKYLNNPFKAKNFNNSYAKTMKFYRACGLKIGEDIETERTKNNYSSITKLSIKELKEDNSKILIQEVLDDKAKKMAHIVAQDNIDFEKWLSFVIRELLRNIPEHSESDEIWYCAQYWPSYDLVELAILDNGIGIKNNLIKGGQISLSTSEYEAIKMALEPGVSGSGEYISDKDWKNSGYGLYMVSNMCIKLNASFIISSGSTAIILEQRNGVLHEEKIVSGILGTAIQIRISPSKSINYDRIRREILSDGEKKARENKDRIHSASKASRGFF